MWLSWRSPSTSGSSAKVLSHEDILMRFPLACLAAARTELPDIRQEAYARVYEAAQKARPLVAKAFLFATARHLMADRVRRERIGVDSSRWGENEYLNVLIDEISPEQTRRRQPGTRPRLARAFDRLSAKCREVVWLRRGERSCPKRRVAARLGLGGKKKNRREALENRRAPPGAPYAHGHTDTPRAPERRGRTRG